MEVWPTRAKPPDWCARRFS